MPNPVVLTDAQRAAIAEHILRFRTYMQGSSFQADNAERRQRVTYFQEELPQRLKDFSEADVRAIVEMLWASRIWGNKDYLAQKIIADNGIDKIRDRLHHLLDTADPAAAYEGFLDSVKGLGPASTTEILTYLHPEHCGIWNRQAREALQALGITNHVNPGKYRLSAKEYGVFNQILVAIAAELAKDGIKDVDLLFVDFFLYEVAQNPVAAPPVVLTPGKTSKPATTFDHDEVRDLLASLGASLGFDSSTEVKVAHGARVDVVWRARIANLGLVTYVFEVHHNGSIDSLILNLQKARSAPSVQKVIAVSDQAQLDKVQKECEGLPEEFRRVLRLWEVGDVIATCEHLNAAMASISALDLIEAAKP